MSSLDAFKRKTVKKIETIAKNTPRDLKKQYIDIAKPSFKDYINKDEAEILNWNVRYNASHITKGFLSKDEFKDDLKALIIKPALLIFEAGYHTVRFTLKCLEVLAHLVAALVELFTKKPDDNRTMLERLNPFGDKAPAFEVPVQDLKNAGDAAVDAVESLVKLVLYPILAHGEFYAQGGSFIAKCLFSLDDSIGDKLNTVTNSISEAMPNVRFA